MPWEETSPHAIHVRDRVRVISATIHSVAHVFGAADPSSVSDFAWPHSPSMVASLKVNVPPLPVAPNKTFINPSAIPPPSHGLYPNSRPSIDPSNTGPGGGGSLASTPAGAINALPVQL